MTDPVPTLYEWSGGIEALNRLTARFYQHVHNNRILAPVFAPMDAERPQHVAAFLAKVLGGPAPICRRNDGPHGTPA